METTDETGALLGDPQTLYGVDEDIPDPEKRVLVRTRQDGEREIRLLVVIENFRFAFYITFIVMAIVGVILTKAFVPGDYGKLLRDVFGTVNICVYFDFPPSTYVLPTIWAFALIFIYGYGIMSIFRVWVAKEEEKVSHSSLILYAVGFGYVVLSFIVFTTCFAVQPNAAKPNNMRIHTAPFTNLIVAMFVLVLLVTWFGERVSWIDLNLHRSFFYFNRFVIVVQAFVVIAKVIHHINCLVVLDGGLWWNPNTDTNVTKFYKGVDILLEATNVAWPMLQSGYLSYLRHRSHCVYVTLQDNREAATYHTEPIRKLS